MECLRNAECQKIYGTSEKIGGGVVRGWINVKVNAQALAYTATRVTTATATIVHLSQGHSLIGRASVVSADVGGL